MTSDETHDEDEKLSSAFGEMMFDQSNSQTFKRNDGFPCKVCEQRSTRIDRLNIRIPRIYFISLLQWSSLVLANRPASLPTDIISFSQRFAYTCRKRVFLRENSIFLLYANSSSSYNKAAAAAAYLHMTIAHFYSVKGILVVYMAWVASREGRMERRMRKNVLF